MSYMLQICNFKIIDYFLMKKINSVQNFIVRSKIIRTYANDNQF